MGRFVSTPRLWSIGPNTVALRLDALQAKGEEVPADLNITGEGGIRAYAYPERAKAIYAETVQQLVAFVKTQQWPGKVVYLAAQEVANNPYEIAQYETFFPVLRNIVGDDAFLIDNGIGYGNDNKIIDRAARDKIKYANTITGPRPAYGQCATCPVPSCGTTTVAGAEAFSDFIISPLVLPVIINGPISGKIHRLMVQQAIKSVVFRTMAW
jgi:hypothetical protein